MSTDVRRSSVSRGFAQCVLALALLLLCSSAVIAGPVISEFMAASRASLLDEDGEASDWIELFNPTAERINLAGWALTDDAVLPAKWRFPERFLEPGAFLVVFASAKNRTGPGLLHTNFRLEAEGEYLWAISSRWNGGRV